MQSVSRNVWKELRSKNRTIIPVVEFYLPIHDDIVSKDAPNLAIKRFAGICFEWKQSNGQKFKYENKVTNWEEISLFIGQEFNRATIKLNNTRRKNGVSLTPWILNGQYSIPGMRVVIRLLSPKFPDDYIIVFWGRVQWVGGVNTKEITIDVTQEIGDFSTELPYRQWKSGCPLDFGYDDCLGDVPLSSKSILYQQEFNNNGVLGCNKTPERCTVLGNFNNYQGIRTVAASGNFTYFTEEIKKFLFFKWRKKVPHTKQWSSSNQEQSDDWIPFGFGRFQQEARPIVWADKGTFLEILYAYCDGEIDSLYYTRLVNTNLTLGSIASQHLGELGGVGSQQPPALWSQIGVLSRLAYQSVIINGSANEVTDGPPTLVSIVKGLKIKTPDINGVFNLKQWSNNPFYISRHILTDKRFARIPESWMDDEDIRDYANYAFDVIFDKSQSVHSQYYAASAEPQYGINFKRFKPTGMVDAKWMDFYKVQSDIIPANTEGNFPEATERIVYYGNVYDPNPVVQKHTFLRLRYTLNLIVRNKVSISNLLFSMVFPNFRGFLRFGFNGKIQIRCRKKADNAFVRDNANAGLESIPVQNVNPFLINNNGYIIINGGFENAEASQVSSVSFSDVVTTIPLKVNSTNGLTTNVTGNFANGSSATPYLFTFNVTGTVDANSSIKVEIDTSPNNFIVDYFCNGNEDLPLVTAMLVASLNADLRFRESYKAEIDEFDNTKVIIKSQVGFLNLIRPLINNHEIGEEITCVTYVYENCNSPLQRKNNIGLDNIIENSYSWLNKKTEFVNQVKATFIDSANDFTETTIIPRSSWSLIKYQNKVSPLELDLRGIDNEDQAIQVTKSYAIDLIDGNFWIDFRTTGIAITHDLGDVIAVRIDSGEIAFNYALFTVEEISFDLNKLETRIVAKIYLSSAFDERVQAVSASIIAPLNDGTNSSTIPPPSNTTGGFSQSDNVPIYKSKNPPFIVSNYSKTGEDIV